MKFNNLSDVAGVTNDHVVDQEYKNALLKVVHDEEPKGVPMGINIEVKRNHHILY